MSAGTPVRFAGNLRVGGEGRYFDAMASRGSRLDLAAQQLEDEFIDAFAAGPFSNVSTPAWGAKNKRNSVVTVVLESFSEKDGEAVAAELLNVARACLRSQDQLVRALMQTCLEKVAKDHAKRHAADFVAGSEE